jgi:hypothetical protein
VEREIRQLASKLRELRHLLPREFFDLTFTEPGEPEIGETEIVSLTPQLAPPKGLRFSYLDSSTRFFRLQGLDVAVITLHMGGGRTVQVPIHGGKFIYLRSRLEVLKGLEPLSFVQVKDRLGKYYTQEYKADNIGDEGRVTLENSALQQCRDVTLLDGPLLVAAVFGGHYGQVMDALNQERLTVIKGREVVGVVKRLEYSHWLYRALRDKFTGKVNDVTVLDLLHTQYGGEVFGPFLLRHRVDRYAYYFRVETVKGPSYFRVESLDRELLERVAPELRRRLTANGIPYEIELADRISKRLSASAYLILFQHLRDMELHYDTRLGVDQALRDLEP